MGYNVGEIREIRGKSVGAEVSSEEALESDWVKSVIKELNLNPHSLAAIMLS